VVGLVNDDSDVAVTSRDFLDVTNLRKLLRILTAALRVVTSPTDVTSSLHGDCSVLLLLVSEGRSGSGGGAGSVVVAEAAQRCRVAEHRCSATRRRCMTPADGRL